MENFILRVFSHNWKKSWKQAKKPSVEEWLEHYVVIKNKQKE